MNPYRKKTGAISENLPEIPCEICRGSVIINHYMVIYPAKTLADAAKQFYSGWQRVRLTNYCTDCINSIKSELPLDWAQPVYSLKEGLKIVENHKLVDRILDK